MFNRVMIVLALWAGCDSNGGGGCSSPVGDDATKPVIDEVKAVSSTVIAGDTTSVAGTARDLNGEMLDYVWSKNAGTFEGPLTNSSIIWRAPAQVGNKTVTLVVVNESGKSATKSVTIMVTNVPTPIVIIDYPTAADFIPSSAGTVNIQARITNTSDVDSAKCFIDGTFLAKLSNTQNPTFAWNVSGLSGPHRVTVQAWSDFAVPGQQKTDSAFVTVNIEGTIGKPVR